MNELVRSDQTRKVPRSLLYWVLILLNLIQRINECRRLLPATYSWKERPEVKISTIYCRVYFPRELYGNWIVSKNEPL